MVESAAAAAGGSVGGVAGRKVGEGLANIFNKVDKSAAKAAKTDASKTSPIADPDPLMEVGPGKPRAESSVPPPPPVHHTAVHKAARVRAHEAAPAPVPAAAPVAPRPLPEVSASDLKRVAAGMTRGEVLQLGPPTARITMFDDGHLLEIYRYQAKDTTIGVVRLVDGSVSAVQMP
jgi:hypothetical protein